MNVKQLINTEMKFAAYGYQVKIRANVKEQDLLRLGAKSMGTTQHEDRYYAPKNDRAIDNLVRIRKEGGERLLFSYRKNRPGKKMHGRLTANRIIDEKQMRSITEQYDQVVTIHKRRSIYLLNDVTINVDHVEHLGSFVEFEVSKQSGYPHMQMVMRQLGLEKYPVVKSTYLELVMLGMHPIDRLMASVHERFGRFAFGISSAVMTTLGLMIGLNTATSSRIAVIGGIVGIAVADSFSDSMGMYASKKSERGVSTSVAFRSALSTFLGKFIFTLTFIIPFMFLPLGIAIYACIAWGLVLLAFVNIQIAFIQEEPIARAVLTNLVIAAVVMCASYLAGLGVAAVLG